MYPFIASLGNNINNEKGTLLMRCTHVILSAHYAEMIMSID